MPDNSEQRPGLIPIPDPSLLTTAALNREIQAVKDIFDVKHQALADRITTSEVGSKEALNAATYAIKAGTDKAEHIITVSIDKLQSEQRNTLVQVETRVNEKMAQLNQGFSDKFEQHRSVDDEKFRSIQTQFFERDKRTEQLSLADKTAIAAALQAQKEAAGAQNESNAAAIAKSEAGVNKQLDGIVALIASNNKANDDKFNDLKSRLDRGEGKSTGISTSWGVLIAAVGLIAVLITIYATLRR